MDSSCHWYIHENLGDAVPNRGVQGNHNNWILVKSGRSMVSTAPYFS